MKLKNNSQPINLVRGTVLVLLPIIAGTTTFCKTTKTKTIIIMTKQKQPQKPKYNTWDNYKQSASSYEYNSGELVTVPNMAYSIKEILEKFTRGQAVPHHEGFYSDTDNFDEDDLLRRPDFDIVDVEYELQNLQNKIQNTKQNTKQNTNKTQVDVPQNQTAGDITDPEIKEPDAK